MSEDLQSLIRKLKQLQAEEDKLIRRIEQFQRTNNTAPPPRRLSFSTGDRVYITNKISKPASWTTVWDGHTVLASRPAVVKRVVGARVYIRTDNGIDTCRRKEYLRHE